LLLDPWYDGALAGKRVVLNAEGAPPRADDRGPLGLSGSYVNLQVVRYLEEYLTAAGARVQQARRTEETPTDRDVVLVTNRFRAEVYVEVRYRRGSVDSALVVKTFYYPGSVRGAVVAGVVGSALGRALGVSAVPPAEKVTFPLQQTACPAIVVEPPSLGSLDEERRLSERQLRVRAVRRPVELAGRRRRHLAPLDFSRGQCRVRLAPRRRPSDRDPPGRRFGRTLRGRSSDRRNASFRNRHSPLPLTLGRRRLQPR
jgi:hypothetical protein